MIRIATLQLGRAILIATALFLIAVLIAAHPPFYVRGAVHSERQAIAITKLAFVLHDPEAISTPHHWKAWLDCDDDGYEGCRWTAGFFEDGGAVYAMIDPRSGKVLELREASGGDF